MKRLLAAAALAAALFAAPMAQAANIVDTAKKAGVFNTLLAAATAAGLVPLLTSGQPLTVFAPTDAAFAKLPKGTVKALLQPKNKDKLAAIIAYHVLPGRVLAHDVPTTRTGVVTLNASEAKVFVERNGSIVKINGINVVQADVIADNSVIHVINRVLWPGEIRG